jgi:hypothetical protein
LHSPKQVQFEQKVVRVGCGGGHIGIITDDKKLYLFGRGKEVSIYIFFRPRLHFNSTNLDNNNTSFISFHSPTLPLQINRASLDAATRLRAKLHIATSHVRLFFSKIERFS